MGATPVDVRLGARGRARAGKQQLRNAHARGAAPAARSVATRCSGRHCSKPRRLVTKETREAREAFAAEEFAEALRCVRASIALYGAPASRASRHL